MSVLSTVIRSSPSDASPGLSYLALGFLGTISGWPTKDVHLFYFSCLEERHSRVRICVH